MIDCFTHMMCLRAHHQVAQHSRKRQGTGYSRTIFNSCLSIHSQWLSKGQKVYHCNTTHIPAGPQSPSGRSYNGCLGRFLSVSQSKVSVSLFLCSSLEVFVYHASFALLFWPRHSKVQLICLHTLQTTGSTLSKLGSAVLSNSSSTPILQRCIYFQAQAACGSYGPCPLCYLQPQPSADLFQMKMLCSNS